MNLRRFVDKARKDRDLAEEIESHLAHAQDSNIAHGLDPEEARRQAHLRFGNPRVTRERVWRYCSLPWMDDLWRNLRFGLRSLAKTPGFAVVAILLIGVAIGVNTAVFSVIDTVLLRPLTYPNPQERVELRNTSRQGSFPGANIPKFNLWHQQTGIFQQVAAYDFGGADATSLAATIRNRSRAFTFPRTTSRCSERPWFEDAPSTRKRTVRMAPM